MISELWRRRKEKKMSQEELAKILGISRQSLLSLERGIFKPSLGLLARLENFFQASWRELFPEIASKYYLQTKIHPPVGQLRWKGGSMLKPKDFFENFFAQQDFSLGPWFSERAGKVWSQLAKTPRINLIDRGKTLELEADLPGFSKEEVELEIRSNQITIKAQRKREKKEEGKDYFYREASSSQLHRTVDLPERINPDKVKAELNNGRLRMILLKTKPQVTGRVIRPE